MHTTNYLPETKISSSLTFSHYAQRLLESEPELWTKLTKNIQHPFPKEEMQTYLDGYPNAAKDEHDLHSALRTLHKRVILHLI
jgi:glutamine synthetase adenylyltransferase